MTLIDGHEELGRADGIDRKFHLILRIETPGRAVGVSIRKGGRGMSISPGSFGGRGHRVG